MRALLAAVLLFAQSAPPPARAEPVARAPAECPAGTECPPAAERERKCPDGEETCDDAERTDPVDAAARAKAPLRAVHRAGPELVSVAALTSRVKHPNTLPALYTGGAADAEPMLEIRVTPRSGPGRQIPMPRERPRNLPDDPPESTSAEDLRTLPRALNPALFVADPEACSNAQRVVCENGQPIAREIFRRIATEAGLSGARLHLLRHAAFNASASGERGSDDIVMTTAMLRSLGNDRDAIAFVIGHEIAHRLQNRRLDPWEIAGRRQAIESHADFSGWELARKAGFFRDLNHDVVGRALPGSTALPDLTRSHPVTADRDLNMRLYGPYLAAMFTGSRVGDLFNPTLTPSAFDDFGRFRPNALVDERVKATYLATLQSHPAALEAVYRGVHQDPDLKAQILRYRNRNEAIPQTLLRQAFDRALDVLIEPPDFRTSVNPDPMRIQLGVHLAARGTSVWLVRALADQGLDASFEQSPVARRWPWPFR